METIGQRVRREREAQGISRKELSRRTKIGYSTLSELERPGGMRTSTQLRVIAEALGVSVRYLETGKGPKIIQLENGAMAEIDALQLAIIALFRATALHRPIEAEALHGAISKIPEPLRENSLILKLEEALVAPAAAARAGREG